jgi:long-subunit fatty acid transport protein
LVENNYGGTSTFDYTEFENDLLTIGEGFSFQFGAIYKADNLRVGLSYHSPVWYQMTDELVQFIITNKSNGKDTIDPGITNIYQYNMSTPSRYSGGLAYVFGSKGLISVQYDFVNYQNASFELGNGDDNFINQNKIINSTLKSAGTLKIGGEYRLGRLSFRGGYFNQGSINKKSTDLRKGTSFGLGYDFGGSALNFALSNLVFERSESMYQTGLTDPIELNKDQFQFLVSYSFKL